ncbi:unnamed protein product [Dovyalis caffra]|uniref:Uncharacterized protein n=1 Tax=Dovyalis caffra TaxID=77055 RepID=A0AAV1SLL5_9ROSI|nr:unnamed protein product [Dovyalis caffra]
MGLIPTEGRLPIKADSFTKEARSEKEEIHFALFGEFIFEGLIEPLCKPLKKTTTNAFRRLGSIDPIIKGTPPRLELPLSSSSSSKEEKVPTKPSAQPLRVIWLNVF